MIEKSKKKYKIYNIFNCSDSSYFKGEVNTLPSKVDKSECLPTLKDYIENFFATGSAGNNLSQYLVEDDDSLEFGIQDLKYSDVEDLKEYSADVINKYNKQQKQKKSEKIEEKPQKDNSQQKNNEKEQVSNN